MQLPREDRRRNSPHNLLTRNPLSWLMVALLFPFDVVVKCGMYWIPVKGVVNGSIWSKRKGGRSTRTRKVLLMEMAMADSRCKGQRWFGKTGSVGRSALLRVDGALIPVGRRYLDAFTEFDLQASGTGRGTSTWYAGDRSSPFACSNAQHRPMVRPTPQKSKGRCCGCPSRGIAVGGAAVRVLRGVTVTMPSQ